MTPHHLMRSAVSRVRRLLGRLTIACALPVWLVTGCAGSQKASSPPTETTSKTPEVAASEPDVLPLADAAKLPPSERTRILVLGTPHLRALDCLTGEMLAPLVERLLAWQPDVVAVEALPGATIAAVKARSDEFAEALRPFTKTAVEAGALAATALKLDHEAAREELRRRPDPEATEAKDRARLALLFAAAYDYPSAVLQWSYLSPDERAKAEVPAALAERLDESLGANNEIYALAVLLARARRLERLALVDDFFGEEGYATRLDAFAQEIERSPLVKEVSSAPFYAASKERLQATCGSPEKLLSYYEWMNSPAYAKEDTSLQWGVWFRTRFESGLDRARYAGWEARNLGIAANIRKESSLHPGKRVLVVYGAAHKPFLDLYLSQLGDVDVLQLGDLRPARRR